MSNLEQHLLSLELQNILKTEYETKNYAFINEHRETPDSLNYGYDLELLQDFINHVKTEAENLEQDTVIIKVCMGQYPEGNFDDRLNPNYNGYQAVFLKAFAPSASGLPIDDVSLDSIEALDFSSVCPPGN